MLWQGRALEAALPRALRSLDDPSDRGLARNIAASVLRWLPDLDELIDARTRMPLPDDARARMVLRMALAQALILETPHHAVVATALPLVEGGPRRLVHGVLSSALKAGDSLPDRPLLPEPWGQRWAQAWGEEAAAAAAAAMATPPPTDLTYKSADAVPPPGEGEVSLLPGHLRTRRAGRVEAWDAYGEGDWWVQDLAAALPARLLAPQAGERIADLCAAPGGKTMQLAATGAAVIAVENNEKRLTLLSENLERTGLSAELLHSDARKFRPEAPLDAVLLDAPCSATGIFRRHPDVLHLRDPERLEETLRIQAALLSHAATLVRPGGRMVYAVCSLEREEGEDQVDAFLDRHSDWHADPAPAGALPEGIREGAPGRIRTLPGDLAEIGGCDGFFMARLVRGEN